VNPFVPYNARHASDSPRQGMDKLAEGGLPMVLSQTVRTMLQSRMRVGLEKYAERYPQVDQLVFEPNQADGDLLYTNVFGYSARHRVCEHAFRSTLNDLRRRRAEIEPLLAQHGLRLRAEVLDDPDASLLASLGPARRRTATTARLDRALDDVEVLVR